MQRMDVLFALVDCANGTCVCVRARVADDCLYLSDDDYVYFQFVNLIRIWDVHPVFIYCYLYECNNKVIVYIILSYKITCH